MDKNLPVVAIVGRTNVGKSTLFNALAGRRIAVVEDSPGVTRDRNYVVVNRYDFPFRLVDTGGLIGEEDTGLVKAVRLQAEVAMREADLIIGVVDGLAGPQPHDEEVVDLLRRTGKEVLWVVNKCERPLTGELAAEFYALGIADLIPISAAHRVGMPDLVRAIRKSLAIPEGDPVGIPDATPLENQPIRVAILGKPNVGKSTLVNRLLGEERVVASSIPGTTRDNIDVTIKRDGREFVVVDTAGLRRKARVEDGSIERYANLRTLRAMAQSDIVVLLLDATEGVPSEQDARIAGLAHERGKGLVIVVNKWDAVEKDHRTVKEFKDVIYNVFKFARYAPIIFTSALTGKRCPSVLDTVKEVYDTARMRIPTSELNRILGRAFERKPPPVFRGQPVKLYFAVQVGVAPPTLVMFVNHPKRLTYGYERYVRNTVRKEYPFEGSDIKIHFKKRTDREDERSDHAA